MSRIGSALDEFRFQLYSITEARGCQYLSGFTGGNLSDALQAARELVSSRIYPHVEVWTGTPHAPLWGVWVKRRPGADPRYPELEESRGDLEAELARRRAKFLTP